MVSLAARAPAPAAPVREDDAGLVARMAAGDRDALGSLYDRHASVLLAVALRILGATREAHDLVHDVFLEAWEHAREYDAARGRVRAWLLVRLRSRALDRLGRAERARSQSLDEAGEALAAMALAGPRRPSEPVDVLAVRQALAKTPEDVRLVLALTYFDGLTAREVADRLQVPAGTVKSRLARGLSSLARLLGGEGAVDDR